MREPYNADEFAHMPKDRRDWFEMYGNQWGRRINDAEPMTAEEKQGLLDALNPFQRAPQQSPQA